MSNFSGGVGFSAENLSNLLGTLTLEQHQRARLRRTASFLKENDNNGQTDFQVSNVRFRVAAPPARPLPVETEYSARWGVGLVQKVLGVSLEDTVDKILERHAIQVLSGPEIVFRGIPENPSEGDLTMLIVARWDDKTSLSAWEKAVKEAKQFVNSKTRASKELQHLDITVEMIAEQLTLATYISHIPDEELNPPEGPSLAADWEGIQDKVEEILNKYTQTRQKATTIALFKYGFAYDRDSNPITVYISVSYDSEEAQWPPVLQNIQQYLDTLPHKLCVRMEHGSAKLYPFELVLEDYPPEEEQAKLRNGYGGFPKYKTTVEPGDDIGPARYINKHNNKDKMTMPGIGTVGCFVEIKTKREPVWTKYALTCFHSLRAAFDGFLLGIEPGDHTKMVGPIPPPQGSDLFRTDHNGLSPSTVTKLKYPPSEIEHPTRAKHCFRIWNCQSTINRFSHLPTGASSSSSRTLAERNIREYRDDITAFFDNGKHILGTIYAASWFARRSPSGGRLDWALIKPLDPARIGKNALPTYEERGRALAPKDSWGMEWQTIKIPDMPDTQDRLKQPPAANSRSISAGDWVYKKGSSTGATVGVFQEIKNRVRLHEDAHLEPDMREAYKSNEHMFIGDPIMEDFARPGDSGAVVFDKEGRVWDCYLMEASP
jgi:hypothetical protein